MRRFGRVLMILMVLGFIVLSGCEEALDRESLVGRYVCESINGDAPEEGVECYLEIVDEQNYTLVYNGHGYAFDFPSTYEVKGSKLLLSGFYDGKGNKAIQEAKVEGDTIFYRELQTDFDYVFKK